MAREAYSSFILSVLAIIFLLALSYLLYILSNIFSDPVTPSPDQKLILDMSGTPLDVAKRYFKSNPYTTIIRSGKKVLCRDGGRNTNVCENIEYLNNKVMEVMKKLNSPTDSHRIILETEQEFLHHVLIEIALVLFQLMDLGLDSGTNFCQKKSSGNGYITICNLTSANMTKED